MTCKMTSRERVRRLLAREQVDRIPNGLGATINTGMHVLAYNKLKRILEIHDSNTRMMSFEANALFDLSVLEAIEADMITLGLKINPARFWTPGYEEDWKIVDIWNEPFLIPKDWDIARDDDGVTWMDSFKWDVFNFNVPSQEVNCRLKCPSEGYHFDPVYLDGFVPLENPAPDDYHPPLDYPDEWLRNLEESARWLFENTEYSIVCDEMINDLQLAPGGLETWWRYMIKEPQIVHEFLSKACEAGLSQLKLLDQAVGKYTDMLMIAHDFGDLRGVQIGPDRWREIYKPHYKRLFTEWHKITNMKISMHSCGSIVDILPDLIECGLDVVNPVQVSARGMDPEILKREFGDQIIFYGGSFDAVSIPVHTSPEEVYEQVKQNIEILSRGGGYIFSGVHNIQWNVPDSHLKAIMKAFRDARSAQKQ